MKTFNLSFSEAELNYLGSLLSERPYKEVVQLLHNINLQIQKQNNQEGEQIGESSS